MAEEQDKESKTEEASEKKIRDSIEKGNTPFSKETPILFSLLAILFIATFVMPEDCRMAQQLATMMDQSYEYSLSEAATSTGLSSGSQLRDRDHSRCSALIVAGVARLGGPEHAAFRRRTHQAANVEDLLIKGWGRIFSAKGFASFLKSVAKLIFATLLVALVLHDLVPR
jgi:flagellar biosynthetic protein FlhB